MTINATPCFCCSGQPFTACCEPVLQDHYKAATPLMLMRSRYTAYILKKEEYLLATWHSSTRPARLELEKTEVKWLSLDINSHSHDTANDTMGEVEFTARYLEAEQLCSMHETSRFTRQHGLWYYLDGTCEINCEKIGRNTLCPCGSGKKFKRCCHS